LRRAAKRIEIKKFKQAAVVPYCYCYLVVGSWQLTRQLAVGSWQLTVGSWQGPYIPPPRPRAHFPEKAPRRAGAPPGSTPSRSPAAEHPRGRPGEFPARRQNTEGRRPSSRETGKDHLSRGQWRTTVMESLTTFCRANAMISLCFFRACQGPCHRLPP
jgi:hypothetical protein